MEGSPLLFWHACARHRRCAELIAAVEQWDGVSRVRIVSRSSGRRFRRHPHLSAVVNGKPIYVPLRGRPRDKCRGYFMAYLLSVRQRIGARQQQPI
jgi:hypothetical protein